MGEMEFKQGKFQGRSMIRVYGKHNILPKQAFNRHLMNDLMKRQECRIQGRIT